MRKLPWRAPSPALIVSVIALVVATGGTGYAAFTLPKNSVGTKQLRNGAVTSAKIKNRAVTGSKINLATLGTVPSANVAGSATNATNATNAANAASLGGVPSSGYEPRIRWALVAAGGSGIIAQSGGISVASHFPGQYYLNWGSPQTGHAIISSLAGADTFAVSIASSICGGGPEGITCSQPGTNDANHTFTFTLDNVRSEADHAFYIASIG